MARESNLIYTSGVSQIFAVDFGGLFSPFFEGLEERSIWGHFRGEKSGVIWGLRDLLSCCRGGERSAWCFR